MRAFPSSVVVLFGALGLVTLVTLTACGGGVAPGSGDGTGSNGSSGSTGSSGHASDGTNEPGGQGARGPGATNGGAGPSKTCNYPTIVNPTECPPAYTRQPPPSCATIGLKCWYPGVGDGDGNGCWSTALLACVATNDPDAGDDSDDGGAPPTGHWVGAQ